MSLKAISNFFSTINSSPIQKKSNLPYWVKITTRQPDCIYYFGPFDSYVEAETMQDGYASDLREENPADILVEIQRCLPQRLTIAEPDIT